MATSDTSSETGSRNTTRPRARMPGKSPNAPRKGLPQEVIPDKYKPLTDRKTQQNEVIEISSDEDSPTPDVLSFEDGPSAQSNSYAVATPRRLFRPPRKIIGGSNNDAKAEIIELSDSSPEPPKFRELCQRPKMSSMPGVLDDELFNSRADEENVDDGSILTLDEPKSARKPFKLANIVPPPLERLDFGGMISRETSLLTDNDSRDVPVTPVAKKTLAASRPKATPRISKKALAAAELERRVSYAQKLFEELNRSVFENKLPTDTKLNWSKRLLTTAGRAKWHRSKEGTQTSEIELAEKILDCDERIRNTLSHEMCHLASWIINANPKEVHGSIFKTW
ncbi:hypothetical protein H0H93_001791 [Arthromyces matolae]|nr:hypothetical protein H0H93_001791 [Arthromyces matolae]